jgi:hypothetical protein
VPPRIGIATFDNPQADQPGPGPAPGSKGFPTV